MHSLDRMMMQLRDYNPPDWRTNDQRVKKLQKAMSSPMSAIATIHDFKSLQAEDRTLTVDAQRRRVAKYAERIGEQAKGYLIGVQVEAVKAIDAISARIAEAFKPADAGVEARKTAILENLAALPRVQRDRTIRDALMRGDREIVKAIATRPHSVRFCIPYVHQEAKEALARMTVGDDVDVLADLQDGLQAIEAATQRADSYIHTNFIIPASDIDARAERAREVYDRAEWQPALDDIEVTHDENA